jgi:hypothetical protein
LRYAAIHATLQMPEAAWGGFSDSRAARELSDALRHALEWSQDVNEGMAAHKENRKPHFEGR